MQQKQYHRRNKKGDYEWKRIYYSLVLQNVFNIKIMDTFKLKV